MKVTKLTIANFRGIRSGTVSFDDHTVLIGTNNSGKSTVVDALAMVLGRDKMVRHLTEHDFYGSEPSHEQRIQIIATITGFKHNDPALHSVWFRDGYAVPKWWNPETNKVLPIKESSSCLLCAQVGFSARFDYDTLTVESIRYFHDDDGIIDPFATDAIVRVPGKLLAEFGLFIVPISRTWDRTMSFGSELFRRLVTSTGGIPSDVLLNERDSLRAPAVPLESSGALGQMIGRVNSELSRILPSAPEIKLRITSTDSDSLLNAIVPHYQMSSGVTLPAVRHGTGLLSIQVLLLLLEFGRIRSESGDNFVLAIEEPELHVPPGIQRRLVYRAQSVTSQTIVTSHSPNVVAFYPATSVRLLVNQGGEMKAQALLEAPFDESTPNSIRKLFKDNREDLVAALMQEFILIPEGRIDYEWLRLLTKCTETKESWDVTEDDVPFGTMIGVIPTHDAAISVTYDRLSKIRSGLVIVVDGDSDGDKYINDILQATDKPRVILRWRNGWAIEDVVTWILSGSETALVKVASLLQCEPNLNPIRSKLSDPKDGVKGNYLVYEDIAGIIADDNGCLIRAKSFLSDLTKTITNPETELPSFEVDGRSTDECIVKVWNP